MSYVIAWDNDKFNFYGSIEGSGFVRSVSDGFVSSIKIKSLRVVDMSLFDSRMIEKDFRNISRDAAVGDMIAWLNDSDRINQKL